VDEPSVSIDKFQYNFLISFEKYKSEKEFCISISTPRGDVEILSELEIHDEAGILCLKNLAIFPKDEKKFGEGMLTKEFKSLRDHLCLAAHKLGFRFLRISFTRIETSSSASPGHYSDLTIDLDKYMRRRHDRITRLDH